MNNLLQLIGDSGSNLEKLVAPTPETERYFEILRTSTERAEKAVQSLGSHAAVSPAPAAVTVPAPSSTSDEAGPGDEAGSVEVHNPQGELEMVLIVDDEEFIVMLAQQVLTDEGYRVVTARNGFQAIEIYRKLRHEISLVILDFVMPVMDGADVFSELQTINPGVPVVLSSGFAEQDRLRGMLSRGLRGFIPKPYTQAKLLDQIRQILDGIRAGR